MQAIKDKFNDMSAMRKAKAEAKEEEKVRIISYKNILRLKREKDLKNV